MRPAAALGVAAACALVVAAAPVATQEELSKRALVEKATAYVATYEQQLTSVVADEEYTQELVEQMPVEPDMPRARRLRSEVFFVFEPVDRQWMAIRDTMLVEGRPVPDRQSVRLAFESMPPSEVRRRFSQMNSQWNLGRTGRNFNEPTLALLVFDREHTSRFTYDRRALVRSPEGTLATLEFRERERPTLIYDVMLGAAFSRGEIVLDPGGTIRRTSFRVTMKDVRVELITEYSLNDALQMWVPSRFQERYERGRKGSNEFEVVTCEARYTNYRRYQVSTRIK